MRTSSVFVCLGLGCLLGSPATEAQGRRDGDSTETGTAEPRLWGLNENGLHMIFGVGAYSLHFTSRCPRWEENGVVTGCYGTEPVKYVSRFNLLSLNLGFQWRLNRYLALELPLSLMFGRANSAARQTVLDSGIDPGGLEDFQIRLHGDIPLTQQLAVFGTVGYGYKQESAALNQPTGNQPVCVKYATDPVTGQQTQTCAQYAIQPTGASSVLDFAQHYVPVAAGLEWWLSHHSGLYLSYQPPIGHNFAFSRFDLDVIVSID